MKIHSKCLLEGGVRFTIADDAESQCDGKRSKAGGLSGSTT
jgi:hypothetical protein